MRQLGKCLLAGLMVAGLGAPLRAEEAPAQIEFVRPLGMGGAFTAVADDHNIFNFNPAGMVQRTGAQVTVLEIAAGGSEDLKDGVDYIKDNESKLTDFENLSGPEQTRVVNEINDTISKLDPRIYLAADIASYVSGPRFLGIPVHVGFGAFGVVDASWRLDSGVTIPNISYDVNNDIVLPVALAKRWDAPLVPGRIGVGFQAKFIRRNQIKQERLSVLQLDDLGTPPMTTGFGIGSDLGLLYQPTDRTNVGLMVMDFLGTKMHFDSIDSEEGYPAQAERDTVIRPRTNIGIAVVPETLLWLVPTNDRWTFAADMRDILNNDDEILFARGFNKTFGQDFGKHVFLGTEFRYWFMRFRGGAYQGYPTFGLGIDIPILKIDYAYYGRELGVHAGDRRQDNHVVSLALRFGSGSTESRERITRAKEKPRGTAVPDSGPLELENAE